MSDDDQKALRQRGLFPAGHVGLSRSRDTRAGACTTFFNVLAVDAHEAREQANGQLGRFDRRVSTVERVPDSRVVIRLENMESLEPPELFEDRRPSSTNSRS